MDRYDLGPLALILGLAAAFLALSCVPNGTEPHAPMLAWLVHLKG